MKDFLRKSSFGLISLFIGGFLLLHAYIKSFKDAGLEYGPMFFPKIVLWFWVILSVCIVVGDGALTKKLELPRINYPVFIKAVAVIIAVCILMPIIGFLPAGLLFFFSYAFILGYRTYKLLVPITVFYIALIWAVFTYVLLIPLPETPFISNMME